MSRHSITSDSRQFSYGFDRPLSTYFFQVSDSTLDEEEIQEGECTGAELLETASHWGVQLPEVHAERAAFDLPIPDEPAEGGSIHAAVFDRAAKKAMDDREDEADEVGFDDGNSDDNWACGTLDPET